MFSLLNTCIILPNERKALFLYTFYPFSHFLIVMKDNIEHVNEITFDRYENGKIKFNKYFSPCYYNLLKRFFLLIMMNVRGIVTLCIAFTSFYLELGCPASHQAPVMRRQDCHNVVIYCMSSSL